MTILLLSLFTIVTSIISATVGLAGGIVLLSMMTFFLPMSSIVPIHGVVQLLSNSSRFLFLREMICWPIFTATTIGLPIGTLIAVKVLKTLSGEKLITLSIALIILYTIFKPKKMPELNLNRYGFFLLGIVIGILNPFIGATGPLLGPFIFRKDLKKEEIISTQASIQSVGHFLKIPAFLSLSFPFFDHLYLIISMSICAIIGTKLGVIFLGKMPERPFRLIFQVAMFFSAVRMIYRAFF